MQFVFFVRWVMILWVSYNDLSRPNSPQMVVYVENSPPTTSFQVGEILYFTQDLVWGVGFAEGFTENECIL